MIEDDELGDFDNLANISDNPRFSSKEIVMKNNFDLNLLTVDKMLQKLEKKYLLGDQDVDMAAQWKLGEHSTHSYYLDTVSAIRSNW